MITLLKNKRTGLPVTATIAAANKMDDYICQGCGIDLTIGRSSLGNYFGRTFPGQVHKPECTCSPLVKNKNKNIDIEMTDIDLLDVEIMTPPRRKSGEGGGGPRGPGVDNEKRTSLKSLRDFYIMGLCDARDFKLNDRLHLRDVMLNRRTMSTVMHDNVSIGKRIVMVKPDFVLEDTQIIRFCGATYIGKGENAEKVLKVFEMKFSDEDKFWYSVRKIYDIIEIPGRRNRYVAKYDKVLLYGRWSAMDFEACKSTCEKNCNGQWRCTGDQYAECVVPQHQIYCPPNYKKK